MITLSRINHEIDRFASKALRRTPGFVKDRVMLHRLGELSVRPELRGKHIPAITVGDILDELDR